MKDGTRIAYQIHGHGRSDILFLPGQISHLDLHWEDPILAEFMTKIGAFARVIAVDRRGSGLSDRLSPGDLPPMETLVADVGAILDEVGSFNAFVFGFDEGGQIGVLFAATHPERVRGLVLYGMSPGGVAKPDMPWAYAEQDLEEWLQWGVDRYGSREQAIRDVQESTPSRAGDERHLDWVSKMYRYGASPSAFLALFHLSMQFDVSDVLPTVRVPTLVIHRSGDRMVPVEAARYVSAAIPNAELVEFPGEDHFPNAGEIDLISQTIERFVEGDHAAAASGRYLATVLFTDIVASTEKAAELGDTAWKDLLERHNEIVREILPRHGGIEIDTAGDSFLATFDGPARGVRCAQAIADAVGLLGLEIRAGLHTGEVETIDGKVGGIAVHIGARVGARAGSSEVLVSSTVKDLVVGSGLSFEDAGEHELKGVPDRWHLYRVLSARA